MGPGVGGPGNRPCLAPCRGGPVDGPCPSPELILGRREAGVCLGGPALAGRVGPGSWSGALPWIRADLRMILLALDLVGMLVHCWYQSLSLRELERF